MPLVSFFFYDIRHIKKSAFLAGTPSLKFERRPQNCLISWIFRQCLEKHWQNKSVVLEGFKMNYFNTLVTKAWCVFTSFLIDNKGASGIEYAIIATIAAIAIALFSTGDDTIADRIEAVLTSVKNALPTTAE